MVPRLSWVILGDDERECLSKYVGYKASLNPGNAPAFLRDTAAWKSAPTSWFDSPPRPPPQNSAAPMVMIWELTKEELAAALSKGWAEADDIYFYNSFSLGLGLMKPEDTSGPSGQWEFGHRVNVGRAGCEFWLSRQCGISSSKVSMRVSQRSAVGGWSSRWVGTLSMGLDVFGCDFSLMVPEGDSLDAMALIELYLVNGKLSVDCSVFSCD